MRRKKHRKISARAVWGAFIFLFIIILLIICIFKTENSIRPAAAARAEHFAARTASDAVSEVISEYLDENKFTCSDFAAILYDENGKIVSVETIPYNINKVQAELTLRINEKLEECSDNVSSIPVGSLMDSYMLAGKGPKLKIRFCPDGKASVKLKSSFVSAGVNQTVHRISAVITADVVSSLPIYSFNTQTCSEFLIAENVIVGDVPYISRSW